jgi:hypothetical protein
MVLHGRHSVVGFGGDAHRVHLGLGVDDAPQVDDAVPDDHRDETGPCPGLPGNPFANAFLDGAVVRRYRRQHLMAV